MKDYPGLPNAYVGYGFSVVFLEYEFLMVNESYDLLIRVSIAIAGWSYYLYVVYIAHEILETRYSGHYSVSPSKATLFHFIPLYNFFWLYIWPTELGEYIQKKERRAFFQRGKVIGFFIVGTTLTKFDSAIGHACIATGVLLVLKAMRRLTEAAEPETDLHTG